MSESIESQLPNFVLPDVENLLPSSTVEVDGKKYTVYYQPTVTRSDRIFAFSQDDNPPELFEITTSSGDKNNSRNDLALINFSDSKILKGLVNTGNNIIKNEKSSDLASLKKDWEKYTVSYQSKDVAIAGTSLHDRCLKKLQG